AQPDRRRVRRHPGRRRQQPVSRTPVPPGLAPIPFDPAGAAATIEACRRAAACVDGAAGVRQGLAVAATAEWRGPARDAFDTDLAGLQREAAGLADDLRLRAAAVQAEWDHVKVENARRAEARARWA